MYVRDVCYAVYHSSRHCVRKDWCKGQHHRLSPLSLNVNTATLQTLTSLLLVLDFLSA